MKDPRITPYSIGVMVFIVVTLPAMLIIGIQDAHVSWATIGTVLLFVLLAAEAYCYWWLIWNLPPPLLDEHGRPLTKWQTVKDMYRWEPIMAWGLTLIGLVLLVDAVVKWCR